MVHKLIAACLAILSVTYMCVVFNSVLGPMSLSSMAWCLGVGIAGLVAYIGALIALKVLYRLAQRMGRMMKIGRTEPTLWKLETCPVKKYVSLLIFEMSKCAVQKREFRRSEGLPASPLDASAEIPSFDELLNRLKELGGLELIRYADPMETRAEISVGGLPTVIRMRFDETCEDPYVSLQFEYT